MDHHKEHEGHKENNFEALSHNLKLSGIKVGLLMNFNTSKLKEGIKRYVL